MKVKTSLLIQLAMFAVTLALGAYYAGTLPDVVPTHWGVHNQVDQYGSKWVSICTGPLLLLFSIGMTLVLPKISPKNFEIQKFDTTFAYAMVLVSALMFFISISILRATAGSHMDIGGAVMTGLFIFFALLGNILGKVQRNFYMGVRTPWTLASQPVWDATHRLAGRVWVGGGILGAILSLAGAPLPFSIALMLIMSFYPVIASYFIYQRIGK